eukprot:192567-Pyramimonas_sp.AAC.1
MAELHVHGGPAVVRLVLAALAALPDFRLAEPGTPTPRNVLPLKHASPDTLPQWHHHQHHQHHRRRRRRLPCPLANPPANATLHTSNGLLAPSGPLSEA